MAIVALLALCDYLLWNWSLSANHDILALVSGMTLIPLLIALAWLLVLAVARLLAGIAQRPRARLGRGAAPARTRHARLGSSVPAGARTGAAVSGEAPPAALGEPVAAGGAPASPSSKLAA
ncbi:MAG: hypothetical protein ACRDLF_05475 [Solirubrobacteraceae bacterium]